MFEGASKASPFYSFRTGRRLFRNTRIFRKFRLDFKYQQLGIPFGSKLEIDIATSCMIQGNILAKVLRLLLHRVFVATFRKDV